MEILKAIFALKNQNEIQELVAQNVYHLLLIYNMNILFNIGK